MKKIFRLLLITILSISLSGTSFAATGFGDTLESALDVSTGSYCSVLLPIDNPYEYDWFVVPNYTNTTFSFSFVLQSPPGINYDMQIVRMNSNGQIYETFYIGDNGVGALEAVGLTAKVNEKVYMRVLSHGRNDYGANYNLTYERYN